MGVLPGPDRLPGRPCPPNVEITTPHHLATIITDVVPGTGQHVADVTVVASATDPNEDTVACWNRRSHGLRTMPSDRPIQDMVESGSGDAARSHDFFQPR